MYDILKHTHSGTRWLTLAFLIIVVVGGLIKWQSKAEFTERDRKLNVFALIFTHIQILIGLVLYFISPRVNFDGEVMADAITRFFVVEHPLTMIIAAVLITVGNSRAKKGGSSAAKFKTTFIFFGLGLLLILSRIPWPFQQYGAAWF